MVRNCSRAWGDWGISRERWSAWGRSLMRPDERGYGERGDFLGGSSWMTHP